MAIPYHQSQDTADVLRWSPLFYRVVHEVLITSAGLSISLTSLRKDFFCGIKRESVCMILQHILFRTAQFDKIVEFVRVKDIIQGMPSISVAGCGLRPRWIGSILNQLVDGHFLVKLRLSQNRAVTPLYGLNLPGFLQFVQAVWQASLDVADSDKDYASQEIKISRLDFNQLLFEDDPEGPHSEYRDDPVQAKSVLARRALRLLGFCIEFSSPYRSMFQFLVEQRGQPIENWDTFLSDFRQLRPSRHEITMDASQFAEKVRNCSIGRRRRRGNSEEN